MNVTTPAIVNRVASILPAIADRGDHVGQQRVDAWTGSSPQPMIRYAMWNGIVWVTMAVARGSERAMTRTDAGMVEHPVSWRCVARNCRRNTAVTGTVTGTTDDVVGWMADNAVPRDLWTNRPPMATGTDEGTPCD